MCLTPNLTVNRDAPVYVFNLAHVAPARRLLYSLGHWTMSIGRHLRHNVRPCPGTRGDSLVVARLEMHEGSERIEFSWSGSEEWTLFVAAVGRRGMGHSCVAGSTSTEETIHHFEPRSIRARPSELRPNMAVNRTLGTRLVLPILRWPGAA